MSLENRIGPNGPLKYSLRLPTSHEDTFLGDYACLVLLPFLVGLGVSVVPGAGGCVLIRTTPATRSQHNSTSEAGTVFVVFGSRFGRCLCTLLLESEDRWPSSGRGTIHPLGPLGETGENGATASLRISKEGGYYCTERILEEGFEVFENVRLVIHILLVRTD